jgi:branched-chain amino acid transport system substrate-binding protein
MNHNHVGSPLREKKRFTRRGARFTTLLLTGSVTAATLIGAVAAGGTASAAVRSEKLNTSNPFIIGAVLPFTGAFGVIGPEVVQGFDQAIAQINSSGGILGREVKLETKDSATDVNTGVLAAQSLLSGSPKPNVMIPDLDSAITQAILPVTTQAKMITFTQATDNVSANAEKYPYNYQFDFTAEQQEWAVLYGLKHLGVKKVAVVGSNDPAGQLFAAFVQDHAKLLGMTFTGAQTFTPGTTDLSVQVEKAKASGADGVAVHAVGPDNGSIAKAMVQEGWTNVPMVADASSVTGNLDQEIPAAVAKEFHAVTGASTLRSGSTVTSPYIKSLNKVTKGNIGSLLIAEIDSDMIETIRWAFNTAGSTNPAAVQKELNRLVSSTPANLTKTLVLFPNPRYSSSVHGLSNANMSKFFGMLNVSPVVEGTYQGVPLTVPPISGLKVS